VLPFLHTSFMSDEWGEVQSVMIDSKHNPGIIFFIYFDSSIAASIV